MVLHEGKPIIRKSGSGKLMIKCLIGLEIPDSGSIKVMGEWRTQPIDIR
jgi:phospholipid/cholesterol/gamma-HCH transport system ATP-binding protein